MTKNYHKPIIALIIFLTLFSAIPVLSAEEDSASKLLKGSLTAVGGAAEYQQKSGDDDKNLATYIGQIIQYFLTTLGVIFLALLIFAGFIYMTARGDSERVQEAKDIMHNVIVGLIIVLMSYAVSVYVVTKVASTTTTSELSGAK